MIFRRALTPSGASTAESAWTFAPCCARAFEGGEIRRVDLQGPALRLLVVQPADPRIAAVAVGPLAGQVVEPARQALLGPAGLPGTGLDLAGEVDHPRLVGEALAPELQAGLGHLGGLVLQQPAMAQVLCHLSAAGDGQDRQQRPPGRTRRAAQGEGALAQIDGLRAAPGQQRPGCFLAALQVVG
ncbi:hypothetical protein JM49_05510 [Pseudomonas chlororaphis subsp. aurantiaca]|nr:hypothetical protein JM49_05510 [Pseudomonas chlororaphis subsp. aurantiaca]